MSHPQNASETFTAAAQQLCGGGPLWKAQFADLIGVRPDSVDAWSKGRSRIPPGIWLAISALFFKRRQELPAHLKEVHGFIENPPEYERLYKLPMGRRPEVVQLKEDGTFPLIQYTRVNDPNWNKGWTTLADDEREIPSDARGYRIVRDEPPEHTNISIRRLPNQD